MERTNDTEKGHQASETIKPDENVDDTNTYVTGHKLVVLVACVAMACFLVLIDTMVISTVSVSVVNHQVHVRFGGH